MRNAMTTRAPGGANNKTCSINQFANMFHTLFGLLNTNLKLLGWLLSVATEQRLCCLQKGQWPKSWQFEEEAGVMRKCGRRRRGLWEMLWLLEHLAVLKTFFNSYLVEFSPGPHNNKGDTFGRLQVDFKFCSPVRVSQSWQDVRMWTIFGVIYAKMEHSKSSSDRVNIIDICSVCVCGYCGLCGACG